MFGCRSDCPVGCPNVATEVLATVGIILRAKWLSYGIMWLIGFLCGNRQCFLPLRHESVGVAGGFSSGYRPLSPKALFPTGGENVCSPEHSKLCFLQHASASAAKNACPCRGRDLAPKSQIVGMGHNGGTATDGQVSPFNNSKHE